MKKLNLLKHYASYYSSAEVPELIYVAPARYISIAAIGSFTEKIFYERIEVLTQAAQAVAALFENSDQAFDVAVLEGLYWTNQQKYGDIRIAQIFDAGPLSELEYRLMIRMPEYVVEKDIEKARETISLSNERLAADIELFEYHEGKCAQMLHLGPFIYEIETLEKIEGFADKSGMIKGGLHHEIYLVDFTKGTPQESLRTILREPIKATGK